MKMNHNHNHKHTFNRLAAVLLSLLLFTENAGILSAVSADELPCDPCITSESMPEEDSAAAIPEKDSGTAMSEEDSMESMLEENSAAVDIPSYEYGDMAFDVVNEEAAILNEGTAFENEDPSSANDETALTYEESAFINEDPSTVANNGEATAANEDEDQVFENELSAFANDGSEVTYDESAVTYDGSEVTYDETTVANDEAAITSEASVFTEAVPENPANAAEEAAFADEDDAAVSEEEILTEDSYGEGLQQNDDGLIRTPAEGSDESKGGDAGKDGDKNGSADEGKSSDAGKVSDASENIDAVKSVNGDEGRGEFSGVLVNPLYAHLYDESGIASEEASFAFDEPAFADLPQYKDAASAAVLVRSRMKERVNSFGFTISGSMSSYRSEKALCDALEKTANAAFDNALEHTGNPTEGDYIWYQYGYYTYYTQYTYSSTLFSADIMYNVGYYTTASQESSITKKVNTVLTQLKLNGKSEYEKILAIYDYICRNVRYDYKHVNDDSYTLRATAYAALINGTAVCQGYSVLLYRMLLETGIDCRVIDGIGAGDGHAWNIARIGSLYYNMDVTWDSPDSADGPITHEWFLKGKGMSLFPDHQAEGHALEPSFIAAYPISLENYDPSHGAVVLPGRIRTAYVAAFTDLSGNARTQKSYSAQNTVMIYGRSSCTASNRMLKEAVETAKSANTGSKIIFLGIDDADDGIYDLANQYPGVTFSPASAANNSTMWELVSLCGLEPQNGTLYLPATFVFDRYGNTAYAFTGEEPDKLSACMEYGSFDERLALSDAGLTLKLDENIFLYKGSAIKPAVRVLRKNGETAPLTVGTDFKVTYSDNNAPGNATVKVSGMNGFTGQLTASFRILQPVVSFSSTKVSLNKKKSKTIYLTVTNGDSVKLSLSNNNISAKASTENATLNKSTLRVTIPITITAGSTAGTTKITATTGTGKKASCTVTVNKTKTKSISVSKTTFKVKKGKTVKLNAKVSPTNSDEPISYKCANTAIATVSDKGVVKGKKKGITKVTITSGSVKKTVTIKVTK